MLIADLISRTIWKFEIPVGIITTVMWRTVVFVSDEEEHA